MMQDIANKDLLYKRRLYHHHSHLADDSSQRHTMMNFCQNHTEINTTEAHKSTFELGGQNFKLWRAPVTKRAGSGGRSLWQRLLKVNLNHFVKVKCCAS